MSHEDIKGNATVCVQKQCNRSEKVSPGRSSLRRVRRLVQRVKRIEPSSHQPSHTTCKQFIGQVTIIKLSERFPKSPGPTNQPVR